ncbi:10305_t:CDS:2, partial [Gigaspora margarita]
MDNKYENLINKANSMKDIQEIAESNTTLRDKLIKSIQDLINLVQEDSYYKSFEKLYNTQIIEKYRPLYEKTIIKIYSNERVNKRKAKYTIPFCSSALHAKNVEITISCVKCDKPRLLFSAKKLLEKNRQILSQLLDTILYTCRTAFHNTCELSFVTLPRQYYKSDKIFEHEYNYKNDSVTGPSNSNQELNIYNIDNEGDDNIQSNKSSE